MDKKISELNEVTISNIDNITNSIYIPVVYGGVNLKIDLKSIIQLIITKIASITPYEQSSSNNNQQSSVDLSVIQEINGRINGIISRVSVLESESTWPLHELILTDGTNEMNYTLKTSPNGGNNRIVITSTEVTKPNFYVTLDITNPTISGTTASVPVRFTASNFHLNLLLRGGQVGEIKLSGSLTVSVQNTTLSFTLNEQSVNLSSNSNFNLTEGTNKSSYTDINFLCTIPLNAIVQRATITGSVNGITIVQLANYSVSQAGIPGGGYITLPSNNGS